MTENIGLSVASAVAASALMAIPPSFSGGEAQFSSGNVGNEISSFLYAKQEKERKVEMGREYAYACHSIALGSASSGARLYFTEKLKILFREYGGSLRVSDWDVDAGIEELDTRLAEKFLELYSKSRLGKMSVRERRQWVLVSRYIDFDRYNADNAIPFFSQGRIVSFKNGNTKVRWFGGDEENLSSNVKGRFSLLKKNECFSCFRTLDENGKTNSIRDLLKIEEPEDFDLKSLAHV